MKTALTISDSDSCGGTGVAADVTTFTMLNVFGMTAITSITAQNTVSVQERFNLEPELIARQIDAAVGDLECDACKTGVLPTVAIAMAVADAIKRNKLLKYVCDPVFKTRKGEKVMADDVLSIIAKRLLPMASVITLGVDEAKALTGYTSTTIDTISAGKTIARKVAEMGAKAVVEIEMTPVDKTQNFHKVYLYIDKKTHLINSGKMLDKNGNRYIYTVNSLNGNAGLTDAGFKFDKAKHPGVEEVNLTQ